MSAREMDRASVKAEFQKRIEAGEPLVSLDQVPALKRLSNSTRANMANDGRIPVIRNGRRFLTLVSLANEALLEGFHEPKVKPQTKERMSHGAKETQSMARLIKMGYKPIPLDQIETIKKRGASHGPAKSNKNKPTP